jgi:hypothetical protein
VAACARGPLPSVAYYALLETRSNFAMEDLSGKTGMPHAACHIRAQGWLARPLITSCDESQTKENFN